MVCPMDGGMGWAKNWKIEMIKDHLFLDVLPWTTKLFCSMHQNSRKYIVKWQDENSNANSWNGGPYGWRYGVGKKTPHLWPWLTQSWNDKRHESSPVFYRHFFSLFSLCVPYQIQCEAWRKHYCATCNPMLTVHFPITYNFNRSDYFSGVRRALWFFFCLLTSFYIV